jgi:GTPase
VIPIFPISNVTGENLDILKGFLNQLPSISDLKNNVGMPTEFLISEKFMVKHKTIVAGTVIKGNIYKKQKLLLGPDAKGGFKAVQAVDVNCLRIPVPSAKCGQACTVHIIDPND